MGRRTRPIIGLNMDMAAATKTTPAVLRLGPGYVDAVLAAGGLPIVMPPYARAGEIEDFLDQVDGFILTGGLDLEPRRLGMVPHRQVRPMPPRREESDRLLVGKLLQRRLPILAIGVGLHQLNVACGGTIIQHLPDEMPRALPHYDPSCSGPHRHLVLLKPNSRLEEIYGEGEIRVNSDHHQALKTPGELFRVTATAPDGVIEGVEALDPNWFCVGVQWHPASETASALDLQLFECFVQAAVRSAQPLAVAA